MYMNKKKKKRIQKRNEERNKKKRINKKFDSFASDSLEIEEYEIVVLYA